MLDGKQTKMLGLRFARALQMTLKTAVMFTVEHKSVERPIQQSFLLVNNLIKEVGHFTIGFVDNQIILNNLLTSDPTLRQLETEFLKRGIAGVTIEPGLTLSRYKKVVQILSTPVSEIEEAGGFLAFLDQHEIEGVRVLPAARNQKKDAQGDTLIETDSESFILSKQNSELQAPRDFMDSIDALLESGCFDPAMRAEVLSNVATSGLDGSGYGVPVDVPKLVILKDGEAVQAADGSTEAATTGGGQAMSAAAAQGGYGVPGSSGGPSGGTGVGFIAGGGGGGTVGSGPGTGTGGGGGTGNVGGGGEGGLPILPHGLPGKDGGPSSFLELVEASVQRSLQDENGNPEKSYSSLARILRNTGVDKILAQFPASKRDELRSLPPEQLAGEYIQETALQLAGAKLTAAKTAGDKIMVEEQVVHLLAKSLQATHMADRLAEKLTKFIQEYAVPPHIQEKIQEELRWTALNSTKKYTKLMELQHFSPIEFRRLLELLKELTVQRDMDRAAALASHYFDFLDDERARIDSAELSRVPELFRTVPLSQGSLASKTADRLIKAVLRADLSEFIHFQATNALTLLAQAIATFENFQVVLSIGVALESSSHRSPEKHKKCCAIAIPRLLPEAATERIIELFLGQRGDSTWAKNAATLLRYAAPGSINKVFSYLIKEEDARNRLALVRLVSQLGTGSIDVAVKYMEDDRWYVVRNMCGVLADLKDPDLVEHVTPALQHSEKRVQQAALKALVKSRKANAASVLASSLSKFAPDVLGEALDELMFMKDGSAIAPLEDFIGNRNTSPAFAKKAIQALASINDEAALHALVRLYRIEELDGNIRRASLTAIANHRSPAAHRILTELAESWGPLAAEARNELEKRNPR